MTKREQKCATLILEDCTKNKNNHTRGKVINQSTIMTSPRRQSSILSVGSTNSLNSIDGSSLTTTVNVTFMSRIKRFQILIWMIVIVTFMHLRSKPIVTPPTGQIEIKNKTITTTTTINNITIKFSRNFNTGSTSNRHHLLITAAATT